MIHKRCRNGGGHVSCLQICKRCRRTGDSKPLFFSFFWANVVNVTAAEIFILRIVHGSGGR